jgi:biopolymer transport protein ExbD
MMAFGGFQQEGHAAPMSEINTTPLVDVMLVLLIIFIVTAPLMTQAIRIDLPQSAAVSQEKPETVTLALDADGRLYWNDTAIEEGELLARIDAAAQRRPQPELHLRADRETRYQKIAEIMGAAREAGIEKLGFVTEPKR